MRQLIKSFTAITLSLSALTTIAAPAYLTTHNRTSEESNAFIAGTIPSPHPTAANSDRAVHWNLVRLACRNHTVNGKIICPAVIKMATNTSNPIEIGSVTMNLTTGDINPKQFSNKGYTFLVNGPGEATIIKN